MRSGYLAILTFVFLSSSPGDPTILSRSDIFDLFPLSPSVKYTYEYLSEDTYSGRASTNYLHRTIVNSGRVVYTILDSMTVADTTRVWTVQERANIWHHEWGWYLIAGVQVNFDTSYWNPEQISTYNLRESLVGNHELQCASMVWTFPPSSTPSIQIMRLSNEPEYLFKPTYLPSPIGGSQDSVWFVAGIGVTQAFHESWFNSGSSGDTRVRMRLVPGSTNMPGETTSIPYVLSLSPNYPNPFNPSTVIEYTLGTSGEISLILYDVIGREMRVLDSGHKERGRHRVMLEGSGLAAGMYIYRLSTMNGEVSRKALLVR
jgi:hypothetical protein